MLKSVMRVAFVCTVACAFLSFLSISARSQGSGKDAFLKNQCNKCHTINAVHIERLKGESDDSDIKPPDLSHVGKERSAAWIVGWLNRTETINGKRHKKKFTGTPAEAQTLANWLSSLK